jgi:hypothetical protein
MADKPLIFVSCGQYHANEKQLGNDICSLLAELRPDTTPYFAEDQSTVDGLSNHILRALHHAAGFICVMHRRGDLTTPDGRLHASEKGSYSIERIYYSYSGAQNQGGSFSGADATLTFTAEGITTLNYWAQDVGGNVEPQKSLTIRIDKTAPTISGMPSAGCALWPPKPSARHRGERSRPRFAFRTSRPHSQGQQQ